MKVWDELNLAFIYMGVLIGAGFASGREIMSFFTVYGERGLTGILVACGGIFIMGYLVLRLSIAKQATSFREILLPYAGERLLAVFEITTLCFLFAGYYIMLAGSTAVIWDFAKLPSVPTSLALGLICVLWLSRGSEGLANFNGILVPLMTALTFTICILSIIQNIPLTTPPMLPKASGSWFISSLLYVSFNTTFTSVVMASLGKYTSRREAALGASLIASLGIFALASALWYSTLIQYNRLSRVQIPLLTIASDLAPGFYWGAVTVLLCAMLTTAVGLGFAFAQGIQARFDLPYSKAIWGLFLGWPLTTWGFTKMIDFIYPFFGAVGIIFGFLVILRRFFDIKIE